MNPFAQLVSPESLAEAIASSDALRQLPTRFYRPLDSDPGRWKKPQDGEARLSPAPQPELRARPIVTPGPTLVPRREWGPAYTSGPTPHTGLRR